MGRPFAFLEASMGRNKELTTVYFEPGTTARLKRISDATKVPMAEYIRQGVENRLVQLEAEHQHLLGDLEAGAGI